MTCRTLWMAGWMMVVAGIVRGEIPGWPDDVRDVRYTSSSDHSQQPALLWKPKGVSGRRPLLVGLHT